MSDEVQLIFTKMNENFEEPRKKDRQKKPKKSQYVMDDEYIRYKKHNQEFKRKKQEIEEDDSWEEWEKFYNK